RAAGVAAVERGPGAGELEDRQRPARARPDLDARGVAGRPDDVDDVVADALGDVDVLERLLHRAQLRVVAHLVENHLVLAAVAPLLKDPELVVARRIADRD